MVGGAGGRCVAEPSSSFASVITTSADLQREISVPVCL